MKRRTFVGVLAAAGMLGAAPPVSVKYPKLVVSIVVDQFRYDYLTRFRDQYKGGLARLLTQGAVFTNANYEHAPTVTAVGHSTVLSGATPSVSGIVANEWYDRASGKTVTSVSDPREKLLGGTGKEAASPRRLMVSTLGDELKMSGRGKPKVFGMSIKDRSAILPAGHMADGAFWFDDASGNFVSSTYYFNELPPWVQTFNQTRAADKFAGAEWKAVDGTVLRKMSEKADKTYFKSLEDTPFGNDVLEEFAERAVRAEKLGQRDTTDVLAVSFSSNDYIGHAKGPDSPEVRDVTLRTDRVLEKLFVFLDRQVGAGNFVVVLTADHGVAPVPEVNAERHMPGGRLKDADASAAVTDALAKKYGQGKWVLANTYGSIYLNWDLIGEKGASREEAERIAAEAAIKQPHVFRVYTRTQLERGLVQGDRFDRRMLNGHYGPRTPDLRVVVDPYWMSASTGTTHGAPFGYDSHVPLILMGPGIKAGRYHRAAAPNDIAPTLATMLDVETPSGSVGRVLDEILTR